MADYYAVLKRTLSGFGEPSESLRAKIYEKARLTITRQLDATQPPLAPETKAAQLAQLDDAIAQTEAEYGGAPVEAVVVPPVVPAVEEEPAVEPTEPVEAVPTPETEVAPEPEPRAAPEPEGISEPAPEIVAPEPVAVIDETPEAEVATEGPAAAETDPLAEAFAAIEAARVESEGAETPAVGIDDDAFSAAAEAERLDGGDVPAVTADNPATADFFNDPAINAREAAALGAPAVAAVTPRKKRGSGVFALLLVVAALGLAFMFRAPLLSAVGVAPDAIDGWIGGETVDPDDPTRPKPVPTIRITPEPETADDPPVEESKREQRLDANGQEIEAAPTREDVNTLPAPAVPSPNAEPEPEPETAEASPEPPAPVVPPLDEDAAPAGEPETKTVEVPITPAEPAAAEPGPAEPGPEETVAAVPEAEPTAEAAVPVAQSALLFEEIVGERRQRSDRGNVVWSLIEESPGGDEAAEPAIRAEVDVPERNLKATITIRRNADKGLTASHLIEVNFQPAEGFSGQNIDEVLAVTMKADERAQGSPLSIVPAKIAPGFFFIALDNLPASRDRNLNLLKSSRWMDFPVEYVTGRRALLSLEKGVVGERVFAEALSAWEAKG